MMRCLTTFDVDDEWVEGSLLTLITQINTNASLSQK